jgi:hypothetical protein
MYIIYNIIMKAVLFRAKNYTRGLKKSLYGIQNKAFSDVLDLPAIDVAKYINKSQGWEKECRLVAECLNQSGVIAIRDPVRLFVVMYYMHFIL